MVKPHLAIEEEEDMVIVDVRSHGVNQRPWRVLKEPLG